MDSTNYSDVQSVASNGEQMLKVDYILNSLYPGSNKPVPDPYYGGADGFEKTYQLLDSAIELIVSELKKKGSK